MVDWENNSLYIMLELLWLLQKRAISANLTNALEAGIVL